MELCHRCYTISVPFFSRPDVLRFRTFSWISPSSPILDKRHTQFLAIEFSGFSLLYIIIRAEREEISYRVFSYHRRNHILASFSLLSSLSLSRNRLFEVSQNFAEFLHEIPQHSCTVQLTPHTARVK